MEDLSKEQLIIELDKAKKELAETKNIATELLETQKELRKAEEKINLVFSESVDLMMLINGSNGEILDVSKSLKNTLGYKTNEVVGKHFSILFPSSGRVIGEKILEQIKIYNGVFVEEAFLKKDGKICLMDLTALALRIENEKIILLTLRDVTERKRVFDEEVDRKKLQGALEMAAAVCHELSQPMQVVLGYTQILTTGSEKCGETEKNILQKIKLQIKRMSEITTKLLNITDYETLEYGENQKIFNIHKSAKM
ncbi:PAS domain S-box protein [bacterium]|nr:PAS domain S-box protein [bacterium]